MNSKHSFEVLEYLPCSGEFPQLFSFTGRGPYGEGFVIKFFPASGTEWVGNFDTGTKDFYSVLPHPNKDSFIIVAGGEVYVIDPVSRKLVDFFGGDFERVIETERPDTLLFSSNRHFCLYGINGVLWETRSLAYEGMRDLRFAGNILVGEGDHWTGSWHKFSVDLITGDSLGGARHSDSP